MALPQKLEYADFRGIDKFTSTEKIQGKLFKTQNTYKPRDGILSKIPGSEIITKELCGIDEEILAITQFQREGKEPLNIAYIKNSNTIFVEPNASNVTINPVTDTYGYLTSKPTGIYLSFVQSGGESKYIEITLPDLFGANSYQITYDFGVSTHGVKRIHLVQGITISPTTIYNPILSIDCENQASVTFRLLFVYPTITTASHDGYKLSLDSSPVLSLISEAGGSIKQGRYFVATVPVSNYTPTVSPSAAKIAPSFYATFQQKNLTRYSVDVTDDNSIIRNTVSNTLFSPPSNFFAVFVGESYDSLVFYKIVHISEITNTLTIDYIPNHETWGLMKKQLPYGGDNQVVYGDFNTSYIGMEWFGGVSNHMYEERCISSAEKRNVYFSGINISRDFLRVFDSGWNKVKDIYFQSNCFIPTVSDISNDLTVGNLSMRMLGLYYSSGNNKQDIVYTDINFSSSLGRLFFSTGCSPILKTDGNIVKSINNDGVVYISKVRTDPDVIRVYSPFAKTLASHQGSLCFSDIFDDRFIYFSLPMDADTITRERNASQLNYVMVNTEKGDKITGLGVASIGTVDEGFGTALLIGKSRTVHTIKILPISASMATPKRMSLKGDGLASQRSIVSTNIGTIFCSRETVYLISPDGEAVDIGKSISPIIKRVKPEYKGKIHATFNDGHYKLFIPDDSGNCNIQYYLDTRYISTEQGNSPAIDWYGPMIGVESKQVITVDGDEEYQYRYGIFKDLKRVMLLDIKACATKQFVLPFTLSGSDIDSVGCTSIAFSVYPNLATNINKSSNLVDGSENITIVGHGYYDGQPCKLVTASTLVIPGEIYYMNVIDDDTITISEQPGLPPIIFDSSDSIEIDLMLSVNQVFAKNVGSYLVQDDLVLLSDGLNYYYGKVEATNGYNIISLNVDVVAPSNIYELQYTKELWLKPDMQIIINNTTYTILEIRDLFTIVVDGVVPSGTYSDVKIIFKNGIFTNCDLDSNNEIIRNNIESIIKTGDVQFGEIRFKKRVLSCFVKGMVESSSDFYVRLISNKEDTERFTDVYVNLPVSAKKWSDDEWNSEIAIGNGGSVQRVGYFGSVPIIADTFSLELSHNENCDFVINNFGMNFEYEKRLTV